ncbi:MAG: hypothetical protein CMJ23_11820 [Phycisphaerae bacterium]|nr:hypothetical protein [Phycisphaerae bacterium]
MNDRLASVFRSSNFAFAATAAIVIATAGCDSSMKTKGSSIVPDTVDALHPDAKSTIEVAVGEMVAFDLPGHAGTGYEWKLTCEQPAFLEQVGKAVFQPKDPSRMGSGGNTRFLYRVTGTGTGPLQYDYARSWETGVKPVRRSTVTVTSTTEKATSGD